MAKEENSLRVMLQCSGCASKCILLITAESMEVPEEPMQCLFTQSTVKADWKPKDD